MSFVLTAMRRTNLVAQDVNTPSAVELCLHGSVSTRIDARSGLVSHFSFGVDTY